MDLINTFASLMFMLTLGAPVQAQVCTVWGGAQSVGRLESRVIDESSGLAIDATGKRLYHHNDSGGGPYFYISDLQGRGAQKVEILKFKARDMEDMSRGPCPDAVGICLYFGDIGDNRARRSSIEIAIVRERETYDKAVQPLAVMQLEYPDRAHNAEGLAIHPNGDLFIVTKEGKKRDGARPAEIFRLSQKSMTRQIEAASAAEGQIRSNKIKLEKTGSIPIPQLVQDDGFGGMVTAADISPDGRRLLLLTYNKVVEFALDLSKEKPKPLAQMRPGEDFNIVTVEMLPQQESLAWMPDGESFLYTSENKGFLRSETIELMRVSCDVR